MSIRFPYSSLPGIKNAVVLMPMVPIKFRGNKQEFSTYDLVDSGATSGVISTVIAEALGIDWRKISPKIGSAVSGFFRFHPVKLEIDIEGNRFSAVINIVEGISPYQCILGQSDFFQRAKIVFERYKSEFEIFFRELN